MCRKNTAPRAPATFGAASGGPVLYVLQALSTITLDFLYCIKTVTLQPELHLGNTKKLQGTKLVSREVGSNNRVLLGEETVFSVCSQWVCCHTLPQFRLSLPIVLTKTPQNITVALGITCLTLLGVIGTALLTGDDP